MLISFQKPSEESQYDIGGKESSLEWQWKGEHIFNRPENVDKRGDF